MFLTVNNVLAQDNSFVPVFEKIDTSAIRYSEDKKRNSFYSVFYIENVKDQSSYDNHFRQRSKFKSINPQQVEIEFDTSQVLIYQDYDSKGDFSFLYQAFPLCLKNISSDTLKIEYEGTIPLDLEAKNKKGKWVLIGHPSWWDCGVGLRDFLLFPNEVVCVKAVFYDGNFETSLRFKTRGFTGEEYLYSEEFTMKINKSLLRKK